MPIATQTGELPCCLPDGQKSSTLLPAPNHLLLLLSRSNDDGGNCGLAFDLSITLQANTYYWFSVAAYSLVAPAVQLSLTLPQSPLTSPPPSPPSPSPPARPPSPSPPPGLGTWAQPSSVPSVPFSNRIAVSRHMMH